MLRDCPRCGLANQPGDYICVRCGLRMLDADLGAGESAAAPPVSAGFARRALARLIDLLVCSILGGAVAVLLLHLLGTDLALLPLGVAEPARSPWVARALMMVSYHGIAESLGGATVGKLLLSLRVVGEDGARPTLGRGLVRNVWVLLDGLFLGLVAYIAMRRSARGQRLGDRFAHTLVLPHRDVPKHGLASPSGTAHGIFIGLAFAGALFGLILLLSHGGSYIGPTA